MKLLNLASNSSFWKGIDYHYENRIIDWKELADNCYQGKVKGCDSAVYNVTIDVVHPRKSVCNCKFAEGRRVICKHMVALDLGIFPEKEQQMMDYMEYYGITDQVYYDVYVSSETSFRDFTFDGYTYCFVASKNSEGIEKPPYSGGVAVTNLERTIVDSIKDMDKISGIEEVVQNVESVHRMQEERLLKYMELYHNQFLYQKMGYLLWQHKEQMGLTDSFFERCKKEIGKSKRYLTRDQNGGCYDDTWKLIVPAGLKE